VRIVARLAGGRDYVRHLARELGVSRPLLHLHLYTALTIATSDVSTRGLGQAGADAPAGIGSALLAVAAIAEGSFVVWLVVKGVRLPAARLLGRL
jgi:hypothetical protein